MLWLQCVWIFFIYISILLGRYLNFSCSFRALITSPKLWINSSNKFFQPKDSSSCCFFFFFFYFSLTEITFRLNNVIYPFYGCAQRVHACKTTSHPMIIIIYPISSCDSHHTHTIYTNAVHSLFARKNLYGSR